MFSPQIAAMTGAVLYVIFPSSYVISVSVEDLSLRIHLRHVTGRKSSWTSECLSGDKIAGNYTLGPMDLHIWS